VRTAGEWNGFENQHALKLAVDAENSIAKAEDGEVRYQGTPKLGSGGSIGPRPVVG